MRTLTKVLIGAGAVGAAALVLFNTDTVSQDAQAGYDLFEDYLGTAGIAHNNPGNLIYSDSANPADKGTPLANWNGLNGAWWSYRAKHWFCIFKTAFDGLRAACINSLTHQLAGYSPYPGFPGIPGPISNLQDFGAGWAPAADNDGLSTYGAGLAQHITDRRGQYVAPDGYFDFYGGMVDLLAAITLNENGTMPYEEDLLQAAASNGLAYKNIDPGTASA